MEAMKRLTIQEKEQLRRDHESGRDICFEDGKAFAQECIASGDTEPDPWICKNVDAGWVAGYITVFDAFKKAVNAGLINVQARQIGNEGETENVESRKVQESSPEEFRKPWVQMPKKPDRESFYLRD